MASQRAHTTTAPRRATTPASLDSWNLVYAPLRISGRGDQIASSPFFIAATRFLEPEPHCEMVLTA